MHSQDHITAYGCDVKRGNLYAEQGAIGGERWSGAFPAQAAVSFG